MSETTPDVSADETTDETVTDANETPPGETEAPTGVSAPAADTTPDENAAPRSQQDTDSAAEDDEDEDADGEDNPLDTEAEIAADYLEELLDIADLDGDIDTYIEGDRAHVSVVSESDVLVGEKGAVLDALQELARLAVMTETGERSRLMLDVAGYRQKRREELVALANGVVTDVKTSGERASLAPMNPFERKIVHDAVAAAGLSSESEGEEPRRRVVVLPA